MQLIIEIKDGTVLNMYSAVPDIEVMVRDLDLINCTQFSDDPLDAHPDWGFLRNEKFRLLPVEG